MNLTKAGLQKLTDELLQLKTVKRRELAERLRVAISHGDLKENFDYSDAKEQQRFLEQRIRELEYMIGDANVILESSSTGIVRMGSSVSLEVSGKKLTYIVTDPQLANPLEGKISADSPIGSALMGKTKGDIVEVQTPGGLQKYTIRKVS